MTAKTAAAVSIQIEEIKTASLDVQIAGLTGLYINRMSAKAKRQLLIGGRKKSAAEKLAIKHDPFAEFRDAMYVDKGWHPHSHVRFPSMAFKNAMRTAALVTPGIKGTDVSRLVFLPEEYVPIFGIPRMRMNIMRSADIKRTPDVRTRPWFETWATAIRIRYSPLVLSQEAILTLLKNAGIVAGVGDSRQEKGKGSSGMFQPVNKIPTHLLDATAQWDAIHAPMAGDVETVELLAEYTEEVRSRK